MQQCQKEYNGNRSQLRDILTVPMQRVLKYNLLVDKLVAETTPVNKYLYIILATNLKGFYLLFLRHTTTFADSNAPRRPWPMWPTTQTK